MKKIQKLSVVRLLAFIFCGVTVSYGEDLWVPDNYPTIQDAVNAAASGDTIRIVQGIYEEVNDPERREVVLVERTDPSLISLAFQGGYEFTGAENPDPEMFPTIVSATGGVHENGRRAFTIEGVSVTIAGLTISDGHVKQLQGAGVSANNFGDEYLIISECKFINNQTSMMDDGTFESGYGGALYQFGGDLYVDNTAFQQNSAVSVGGAIAFTGGFSANLFNCEFAGNSAGEINGSNTAAGGAIYFFGLTGQNDISSITSCNFSQNSAFSNGVTSSGGGAIALTNFEDTRIALEDNRFVGNHAEAGGAIALYTGSNIKLKRCRFFQNEAEVFGEGEEDGRGGAIYVNDSLLRAEETIFVQNSARSGGAVFIDGNTIIGDPLSSTRGDIIFFINCLMAYNSCTLEGNGKALMRMDCPVIITLIHCTVTDNIGPLDPRYYAIYNGFPSQTLNFEAQNCIIENPGAPGESEVFPHYPSSYTNVGYSNINQEWPGEGNIDEISLFVDPTAFPEPNYRLLEGSPEIDLANPTFFLTNTDIDSINDDDIRRPFPFPSGRSDMGYHEWRPEE